MPAGKLHWYYVHAGRCSRWATETTSDEHREAFLNLAQVWRALALKEQRRRTVQSGRLPPVIVPAARMFISNSANLPSDASIRLKGRAEAA